MRKLLKQPWFVAVLAIGAVVLCALSLRDSSGASGSGVRRPTAGVAPEPALGDGSEGDDTGLAAAEPARASIPAILEALVFPATIPDPFTRRDPRVVAGDPESAPLPTLPDEQESIQLTAVWQQGDVRLALINNRIVRAGDHHGRLTIDEIGVDGIWVSHWKGRDFVAFGAAFTLLTPATGAPAPSLALHEN